MDKVTYFDVEYANSRNKSICQIGLMCENPANGDPIYPELDIYINPDDGFDNTCIRIHGITPQRAQNEPTFDKVWPDIEKYFTNAVVVGHNVASADLDALTKALFRYNFDIPEFYYICTMELAKKYIPRSEIENYGMGALCEYFDIDIESAHNAFDDACANADLLKELVRTYSIDLKDHVRKYSLHQSRAFTEYVSSPVLRKSLSEFYGMVRGFSIDNELNNDEVAYIQRWRDEHAQLAEHPEIAAILETIDRITDDGVITLTECLQLQHTIKNYLDLVQTSPVTLATQILDGIMKGILADGEITDNECHNLRLWLYDNIHLAGHYPFDRLLKVIDEVLEDSRITEEEREYVASTIRGLLNPVEELSAKVSEFDGKHVCLSGNFAYGPKSAVEKYLTAQGAIIEERVTKKLDMLIIGDSECLLYSNGTYGTKVKKAIEYNDKGCNIQILKECDAITSSK